MAQRKDIHKVLIIGSGPIIIGQACEFDYSGTQACKALRSLGYEIVLVNSNPATIMTDPEMADVTYIEPLNVTRLEQIIAKERPDALLPNLGGQSGLNLCAELNKAGVLDKYNVKVIGVQVDAIERGEDRIEFKNTMNSLGIEMARSEVSYSVDEALAIADKLGYPVVLRPAYTMGGAGGGLVYNKEELKTVCARGLQASIVGQVLVEESILGWEELELEVVRDKDGNMITVCFIENVDPMGVHTGDSFCTAPMLTISQDVMDRLQEQAYRIVESIQVIGGTNVQFAHDPKTDRIIVIEINPRTSRSSALASKATGFPIALVSAMLASGLTLKEIPCGKYGTLADYKPDGDYVVVKFARWAFEKFKGVEDHLGTQMRAVGEVMSIGKTYKEAFQKAVRSLEKGRYGLGHVKDFDTLSKEELLQKMITPSSERHFMMYEALRKGATVDEIHEITKVKNYFIEQMKELVDEEEALVANKGNVPDAAALKQAKLDGFSDKYLSEILSVTEEDIRNARENAGVTETWDRVHVSGTENSAYYYSTYHGTDNNPITDKKKIMILGGGPNRIGQGIEFDYCCVHAAKSLKKLGFETIIVNCNPETVSTDYDTSDKLYFEPLTLEDVLSIYNKEKPVGVIAQFGGQTPLNLAADLEKYGVKILGTSPAVIDLAEDRDQFRAMMDKLGIPMPESGMATTVEEATEIAKRIGYPVMVRPSYVLGGRGMEVVYDEESIADYMRAAVGVTPDRPILIDRFLHHALECEADAISDGTHAFVPAVMEHIELAGIHSGDSACIIPSKHINAENLETIKDYTRKIAEEMHVVGLMNMQYAIEDGKVFVLEANPRASRTVPLVSKVCGISMVPLATDIITNELTGRTSPVAELNSKKRTIPYYGVKEAVFPFNMFPEVDPILGPEMRSTGEVLGISNSVAGAFFKAEEGAQATLPTKGSVLISVNRKDKPEVVDVARSFHEAGFKILATGTTCDLIAENDIPVEKVNKLYEGRPNILDLITNEEIQLIVNTPIGKDSAHDDSYLRKAAIKGKIPYITTMAAAKAAAEGVLHVNKHGTSAVKSLQEWHKMIEEN
ncbi:MAG: carbamoyl-phosphate synthase large subunit [Lachnospiraceae bacterium]|nr:carbamoyl-phosphate synthase large subunit [Lachnospiraceae bacterium]